MKVIYLAEVFADNNLRTVAACLKNDGVIAYPTDTLYGLGGNFFSPAANARIDAMKERSDQPYSVAVGDLAMLKSLVAEIPEIFGRRLQCLLPGRFTFLFKPDPAVDRLLLKNSDRIGLRIPGLPPLLRLIREVRMPLISTSVNRSGRPPLNDPQRIAREFPGIDLLIDGGVLHPSKGSTLVDITVTPPRIVRRGDDLEKILAALAAGRMK
jgi:L-threonylcarbamoyladenylate synthase